MKTIKRLLKLNEGKKPNQASVHVMTMHSYNNRHETTSDDVHRLARKHGAKSSEVMSAGMGTEENHLVFPSKIHYQAFKKEASKIGVQSAEAIDHPEHGLIPKHMLKLLEADEATLYLAHFDVKDSRLSGTHLVHAKNKKEARQIVNNENPDHVVHTVQSAKDIGNDEFGEWIDGVEAPSLGNFKNIEMGT